MTLENRVLKLEERRYQKKLALAKGKQQVPIGVLLGCGPEMFINWYDWALHETSVWHSLSYRDKYEISREFNFKLGFNIPAGFEGLTDVELLETHVAFIDAEARASEESKGNEEVYYRVLQEEEGRLKGTIKRRI